MSYTYDDTPPLRAAATVIPLIVMRPSPTVDGPLTAARVRVEERHRRRERRTVGVDEQSRAWR